METRTRNDLLATAAAIVATICLVDRDNAVRDRRRLEAERRRLEAERRQAVQQCLQRATFTIETAKDKAHVIQEGRTSESRTCVGASTGSAV
jgi:hypothetical protein